MLAIGDIRLEPDLPCPPRLLRLLAVLDMELVRQFVPLLRETATKRETLRVVRLLEAAMDDAQRVRFARVLAPWLRWNRHEALELIYDRWKPPPPEPVALPRGDKRWLDDTRCRRYGLTASAALAVLDDQDYRCCICRRPFVTVSDTCMDHNHGTGAFRGFLCVACNTGLGLLGDSPERLRAAAAYLAERGHYGTEVPA